MASTRRTAQSHSPEWLFCIALSLLLTACGREPAPLALSGATMGTFWNVTCVTDDAAPDAAALQSGIQRVLDEVNTGMSTYRPDSELSRFNTAPLGEWIPVSAAFLEVLGAALAVGEISGGAYDVTVGPIVDLWGFGPGEPVTEPPSAERIAERLQRVGQHHLEVDAGRSAVRKTVPVALDFSSLAKGYAVDRVARWLQEHGVARFMVEVGGEVKVAGLSPRGDPWRIAIERPENGTPRAIAAVEVTDVAVATSGDYRNFFEYNGRRYSHSIDARTGWPVAHDLVSVTVIHESAMLADAWATALIVLGGEAGMAVARAGSLAVYFIYRDGTGFRHEYSPAMARYLLENMPGARPGEAL